MTLYTDGAFSPSIRVGAYSVIRDVGQIGFTVASGKLGKETSPTSNIAELMGVIAALKYAIRHGEGSEVTILSDSQYVVNTYNKWMMSWKNLGWRRKKGSVKNLELIKTMYKLRKKAPNVTVKWVKGHAGNRFNEIADKTAKSIVK